MLFGFHTILNLPTFGARMQTQAVANAFELIELLNGLSFLILLANLLFKFPKNDTRKAFQRILFLALNVLVSALLYPATIFVPVS
jgi:hypothetical protein